MKTGDSGEIVVSSRWLVAVPLVLGWLVWTGVSIHHLLTHGWASSMVDPTVFSVPIAMNIFVAGCCTVGGILYCVLENPTFRVRLPRWRREKSGLPRAVARRND